MHICTHIRMALGERKRERKRKKEGKKEKGEEREEAKKSSIGGAARTIGTPATDGGLPDHMSYACCMYLELAA